MPTEHLMNTKLSAPMAGVSSFISTHLKSFYKSHKPNYKYILHYISYSLITLYTIEFSKVGTTVVINTY